MIFFKKDHIMIQIIAMEKCLQILLFVVLVTLPSCSSLSIRMGVRTTAVAGVTDRALSSHPDGNALFRIWHPAFPLKVLDSYTMEEAENMEKIKQELGGCKSSKEMEEAMQGLPWNILPSIGVSTAQDVWSQGQIDEAWKKNAHCGTLVWAHKLDKLEANCVLLNHWKQMVIKVTSYDRQRGARGIEIGPSGTELRSIVWPPLSLELELKDRHWQPVAVSRSIFSEVLPSLPTKMTKAPWELIFLLLLSSDKQGSNAADIQAFFDTGLSPRQGLIAYMRLLRQAEARTALFEDIPTYRKIVEKDIIL
jgi:hypothetical protein